jgi:hypothetical protein
MTELVCIASDKLALPTRHRVRWAAVGVPRQPTQLWPSRVRLTPNASPSSSRASSGSEAGSDVRWGAACLLAGALVLGVSAKPACAEDVSRGGGGWTFHVTPYAWATAFNGNATIRGQKSDVDASFSDVIQDLDYGLLAQIEADKGPWGLVAQGNYLNASSDGSVGPVDAKVDANAFIGELFATYRLGYWPLGTSATESYAPASIKPGLNLDALGGFIYTYVSSDLELKGTGPLGLERHFNGDQDWVTPFAGARTLFGLDQHWFLAVMGYYGTLGSDNSVWNLQGLVGYAFNRSISVAAGYRALYQNYENGNDNDKFHYDITTHGPVFGVTFTW